MATANFIPGVWDDALRLEFGKVTVLDHFTREFARKKRADGFELVDIPAEWIAAREAFWKKFQALTDEGVENDFIQWVPDEGYEKTSQTKHWVKKESN